MKFVYKWIYHLVLYALLIVFCADIFVSASLIHKYNDRLTDSIFPAVVSLVDDTSVQELQKQNDQLENSSEFLQKTSTNINNNITSSLPTENENESTIIDITNDHVEYIVKAEPKVILHVNTNENTTLTQDIMNITQDLSNTTETNEQNNIDSEKNTIPVLDSESNRPKPSETMPVFSEWAQKQLEEAEKINKASVNISNNNKMNTQMNKTVKNTGITAKNYASPDCNAKIIAANPESSSMSSVLSPLRDEYALNTCTSKIWFVVELCESIQARRIDLANFELFSSSPKDFTVYTSARFPSRDWTNLGQFTAKDERVIQSFDLEHSSIFGKYVKVEIQTHYGKEHFCPVSLFRVYGTSEFEAFETENPVHNTNVDLNEDDDGDLTQNINDQLTDEIKNQTELNLFGSARDAVMSIMKKAAEVLTKSVDSNVNTKNNTLITTNNTLMDTQTVFNKRNCRTPSHIIVCDNCSDLLYSDLYEILSCCNHNLDKFIKNRLIKQLIHNTDVCLKYGLDFTNSARVTLKENATLIHFFDVFFARKYQAALCNTFAILENKVVLNISQSFDEKTTNTDVLLADNNKTPIVLETNTLLPLPANQADLSMKQKITENVILTDNIPVIDDVNQQQDVVVDNINQDINQNVNKPEIQSEQTENFEHVQNNIQIDVNTNMDDVNLSNIIQINEENVQDTVNLQQNNNGDGLIEEQNEITQDDTLLIKDGQQLNNENFENIFIDLVEQQGQNVVNDSLPSSVNTVNTVNTATANTQNVPKETILIRLSNRIKALERNMSLSGQYLEELSRRYRNKVEELHLAFDSIKTQISDEIKSRLQQDELKTQQILQLRDQIAYLTNELRIISEDKQSFANRLWFSIQFIVVISMIIYIATELFWNKNKIRLDVDKFVKKKRVNNLKRRKSVEGVSGHHLITKNLRRRPSTEALNISGTYADLLVQQDFENDDRNGEWFLVTAKNNGDRRRKRKRIQKSMSTAGFSTHNQNLVNKIGDFKKNEVNPMRNNVLNDLNDTNTNTRTHTRTRSTDIRVQNTDRNLEHTHTRTNSHTLTHTRTNSHTDRNTLTHTRTNSHTDRNTLTHTRTNSHTDRNLLTHTRTQSTHSHTQPNTDTHTHIENPHTHTDTLIHANTDTRILNTDRDLHTHTHTQDITHNLEFPNTANEYKIVENNVIETNDTKINTENSKFPGKNFLRTTLSYRSSKKKKIDRHLRNNDSITSSISDDSKVNLNNSKWEYLMGYRKKKTAHGDLENGGNFSAENLSESFDLNTSVSTVQDDVSVNSSVNDKSSSKNKTYLKRIFKRVF